MWVCRKCHNKSDGANRICRACGGILEEVAEAGPFQGTQPAPEETTTASPPPSDGSTAPATEEPRPIVLPAGPAWACPKCGETVPGNFEVCWNCLTGRGGEPPPEPPPPPAPVENDEQEIEAPEESAPLHDPEPEDEPWMGCGECPRCGSRDMMRDVTVMDQGEYSDGKLKVVVLGSPDAIIFKDRLSSEIKADICGRCGHIEFRVADPQELYEHYRKSLGMPRSFATRMSVPVPCQRCHMLMAKESVTCPHCGASQPDS